MQAYNTRHLNPNSWRESRVTLASSVTLIFINLRHPQSPPRYVSDQRRDRFQTPEDYSPLLEALLPNPPSEESPVLFALDNKLCPALTFFSLSRFPELEAA